jgi:hypothetical protein
MPRTNIPLLFLIRLATSMYSGLPSAWTWRLRASSLVGTWSNSFRYSDIESDLGPFIKRPRPPDWEKATLRTPTVSVFQCFPASRFLTCELGTIMRSVVCVTRRVIHSTHWLQPYPVRDLIQRSCDPGVMCAAHASAQFNTAISRCRILGIRNPLPSCPDSIQTTTHRQPA